MTGLCEHSVTRRSLLGSAGMLFAWSFVPRTAFGLERRDFRFVCVVLRGAMDGLSAVAPLGDPDYGALRESIALSNTGEHPALDLNGFFALHPAMPNLARLYRARQATVFHAVSTGYRGRSHFDGQDVLESGQPVPGRTQSGWLNRLVQTLPKGDKIASRGALGVGAMAPLIVRGPAPVLGWVPPIVTGANDDLAARVLGLYAATDPLLRERLNQGIETGQMMPGQAERAQGNSGTPEGMVVIANGAADLIAADNGPRIAALAFDGWDTHANEGGASGRLSRLLGGLDQSIAAFEKKLQVHWRNTVLMVVTEFGRTVRVNGTVGTDHGTATVAFLVGGAVSGGRVITQWPGLKQNALYEGRDLAPTLDVRSIAKGVVQDLFGVTNATLADSIFPETGTIKPLQSLVV